MTNNRLMIGAAVAVTILFVEGEAEMPKNPFGNWTPGSYVGNGGAPYGGPSTRGPELPGRPEKHPPRPHPPAPLPDRDERGEKPSWWPGR
jgi:hypothetical protein